MTDEAAAFRLGVVQRARAGEAEAFVAVYDRYATRVHTYAFRLLGNQQWADEVVHETFVHASRSLRVMSTVDHLELWLYRIASLRCFSLLRRRRLASLLSGDMFARGGRRARTPSERSTEQDLVMEALRRIPPLWRAAFLLRQTEGYSCEEIAEVLGSSPESVASNLARARHSLSNVFRSQKKGLPV